jgi:ABC-type glycerol-3-phosphate transport system substrate-binding protein
MRGFAIAGFLLLAASCSGNPSPAGASPTTEYLCNGRDNNGNVTERIDAGDRDEAIKKFKEKHTDIPVATCTPNPRR